MAPFAIGDSANIVTSRGYDVETQMQETKPAMVRVLKATESELRRLNMWEDGVMAGFDAEFPQDREGVGTQKDFDVRDNQTVQ